MKFIYGLQSIPEFDDMSKASQKEAWMTLHHKVRSIGSCRLLPVGSGLITAACMALIILPIHFYTELNDFIKFAVMVVSAAVGGYLGGVFAMSFTYKSGKQYLNDIVHQQTKKDNKSQHSTATSADS